MTRDTTGNPAGGDARAPRRPSDRRRQRATAQRATAERATGGPPDEDPWTSELTGPHRTFPVWDGVPGYEFESRRSAPRPPAGHGRAASHGPEPQGGPHQFRYTPTVSQPLTWPRDDRATPGFEFDPYARTAGGFDPGGFDPYGSGPYGSGRYGSAPSGPAPVRPAPREALGEWVRLLRSFLPEPVKRTWFAEFRSALHFRGAGTRVIIPILAMIVFGVAVAVIAGANGSNAGPAPPPAALGFPPATLAGSQFSAAANGRGISQMLGQVTSDGAEIVAVGSQQGARISRAQFFVSTDDGRSWSMGRVRTRDGGPPPPGLAARFVAGGHGAWVALGPGSIWTSPDGRTWTLAPTAGLPLRPGDQISVLRRTAAGFVAVGSNVTAGVTPVVFVSANGINWQRLGAAQLPLNASTAAVTGRVLGLRYAAAFGNQILIAGDVTATQSVGQPRHTVTIQTSAAWLSSDGGTTWTLAVPPGNSAGNSAGSSAGSNAPAGPGAQARISGVTVTAHGFVLLRPATVAGRPAVDAYLSANGTAWTFAATLGTPAGFVTGMADGSAGNGVVVTGQAGPALIAFTSTDGASWRPAAAFGTAAAQVVSGVAMAQGGTVVTAGTTTDDPDSRQPLLTVLGTQGHAHRVDVSQIPGATDPQLAVNDVAAGNGMQVAVGSANGYPAAWISANGGGTWTRAGGQTQAVLNRPGIQQLTSVTFGIDGWLAVGGVVAVTAQHPVVLGSGNGRAWVAADGEAAFTQPGLFTMQAAAGNHGYVIVGYQSLGGRTIAVAWRSAGLTGWHRAAVDNPDASLGALDGPPGASRQMLAVVAGPRGFVAVGSGGNAAAAWTSPDGQAWTQQNVPLPYGATRAVLTRVASNGHTVVAVGTALTAAGQQLPFAASSADGGRTWTESALPVPVGRAFVTALTGTGTGAGGGFLATGTFGRTAGHQDVVVWTSPGGSAWTAATPAGQGLTGSGIQAITGLTVSGRTLSGVGFTATPGGEQPVLWQSPVR